jgi:PAS domain S-box-containing protein
MIDPMIQNTDQYDILIADDNPDSLELLGRILNERGYRVRPAPNGRLALESVAARLPDLILLDVKMPEMNGYEVCRRLKSNEKSRNIPVIFISAYGESTNKVKGFKAGGVDYIAKPFEHEEVLARVASQLRLHRLTEHLEQEVNQRTADLTIANQQLRQQITERQRMEEALRKAHEDLKQTSRFIEAVFSAIPVPVFYKDKDGRYLGCNLAFSEVMGVTSDQIAGKTVHEIWPSQHAATYHEKDLELVGLPPRQVYEYKIKDKDGLERPVIYSKNVFRDENDQVAGIIGTFVDITDRKRVEEALRESRQRLDNIVANSPCAIYRCANDPEWTMEFLSAAITRTTGYPADDFLNNRVRSYASIIHPDDRRAVAEAVATGLESKARYEMDYRVVAADGTLRWVHEQGRGVFTSDGDLLCLDGVIFDITAERQAEEALRKSEALLSASQHLAKVGGWEFDVKSGKSFWTEELYRIHELPNEPAMDLIQESLNCYRPEDRPTISEAFHNACETGEPYDFEFPFTTHKGRHLWIRTTAHPVYKEGEILRLIGNVVDITERKAAETKIRQLNEELEQRVLDRTAELEAANKELEAFAYSVSHDLRAPLRHIDGFMGLLQKTMETELDGQSRYYMDAISDSASKMGQLIDDLLSFSRMGRHALSVQPVDLGTLAHEVIRELEPDAAGRDLDWRIGDLPAVSGDASLLRMVLANLIANALKFTRPREKARIEIGSQSGQEAETVIYVRDNGVGFDMTYADKLFGVFQRLHRAEDFEGTGIGLANVRRIIARHGGRVWAEGEVNNGATFYLSLPQAIPEK